ncbi:hypothetical protein CQW23_02197 [Capsicum baccatum]|uniref:Uncharacterized protein n=1 Tax=Capsicum baccatum TaxID=33114 RepID=A0A2G2XQR6_CAPBA|nr:hypothetical protein CQW23_02197 [Capsicum baccatum]
MDIEAMFLSEFSIEKKPDDIFHLIEVAILVAQYNYAVQLEKRKNKLIKMLLYPDRDEYSEDDGSSTLDEEEEDSVGDEDEVTKVEEEKETQQITAPTNQKPSLKFRVKINSCIQVAPLEKHNNCNAMVELKKSSETNLVKKQLEADKQRTRQQSHNTTTMRSEIDLVDKQLDADKEGTRKRNMPAQVAPRPRGKLLVSDFSFEEQLDGDKQLKKQTDNGFRKIEENKREEQKECTTGLSKSMLPPLMKMNNEATKRVQVTPNQKQLLPDFSPKKQSNCIAITRPMQRKETQSIRDTEMKFATSKRKFEERLAEQSESKRRIIMVDFHDMPKPAKDTSGTSSAQESFLRYQTHEENDIPSAKCYTGTPDDYKEIHVANKFLLRSLFH